MTKRRKERWVNFGEGKHNLLMKKYRKKQEDEMISYKERYKPTKWERVKINIFKSVMFVAFIVEKIKRLFKKHEV